MCMLLMHHNAGRTLSVCDVKERVSVEIWMKCALHRVHFTVGACLLALPVSSAEQQQRRRQYHVNTLVSTSGSSQWLWLHYIMHASHLNPPLNPSTRPLTLCATQCRAAQCGQTDIWMSRPTNGTGPPKLGLLSHTRVVRAAYLSNCVRPTHNSRRAGTEAPRRTCTEHGFVSRCAH
jgi:hypothetical protein